jgi:hypothetical protein
LSHLAARVHVWIMDTPENKAATCELLLSTIK